MAKVGGFDPNVGVTPFADGHREIGRANLPASLRVIPDSPAAGPGEALVFGRLSDSALLERFAAYLAPVPRHRELLAPEALFEALERAAGEFGREAGEGDGDGRPREGPMAQAARTLRDLLADRDLCETLRRLVLRA